MLTNYYQPKAHATLLLPYNELMRLNRASNTALFYFESVNVYSPLFLDLETFTLFKRQASAP